MHLPNLVQMTGFGGATSSFTGGYLMIAFVRVSLKFGNLLKPITGLSWNRFPQSALLEIMFQIL